MLLITDKSLTRFDSNDDIDLKLSINLFSIFLLIVDKLSTLYDSEDDIDLRVSVTLFYDFSNFLLISDILLTLCDNEVSIDLKLSTNSSVGFLLLISDKSSTRLDSDFCINL